MSTPCKQTKKQRLEALLTDLKDRLAELDRYEDRIDRDMRKLHNKMDGFGHDLGRLDSMDKLLLLLDERVDKLEKAESPEESDDFDLADFDGRICELEADVSIYKEKFHDNAGRLWGQIEEIKAGVKNLRKVMHSFNERIAALEKIAAGYKVKVPIEGK